MYCTRYHRCTVLLSCPWNGSKVQVSVSQLFVHSMKWHRLFADHQRSSIWPPIFWKHLGTLSISFHFISWNFGWSPVLSLVAFVFRCSNNALFLRFLSNTFSSTAVAQRHSYCSFQILHRDYETISRRWFLDVPCTLPPAQCCANDLIVRMSRKAEDSGDQEVDSFDHVKVIHSDYGMSSISTSAFDEDHTGALGQGFRVCISEEFVVCRLTCVMC